MNATALNEQDDDSLNRLIAAAGEFSVEFPYVLANHLPMVLYALHELGADDARLEGYFETYRDANGLVPVPPAVAPIESGNWRDHLGERDREADYRAFFAAEGRRLGGHQLVSTYWPQLVAGIAASALHGSMRLAYACLRGDAHEMATALAYLSCTYLPLRPIGDPSPAIRDPVEILNRMRAIDSFRQVETETDLLWHWMRATAAKPEFIPVIDWLDPSGDGLHRVAGASLRLMAATMTFEAVHAVTGTHWVRLLAGHGCDAAALRYFWQAIASVYPKIGMPALPDEASYEAMRQRGCPDWPEIAAAAVASDDEHDHSFVFSAREEQKLYGDRLYQMTAARRVGLIS